MHLIDVIAGRLALNSVGGHTVPHLILHDEHTQLFQLLAQVLDVVADQAVMDVHIGAVVEHVERTGNIQLQSRCNALCFLLIHGHELRVQVTEDWHVLRTRVCKVAPIDISHRTVDDCLFHGLQAILAAYDQLAER